MGGSKNVEAKEFSELGLPGVEIVGARRESIFTLSRASKLEDNAESNKHMAAGH